MIYLDAIFCPYEAGRTCWFKRDWLAKNAPTYAAVNDDCTMVDLEFKNSDYVFLYIQQSIRPVTTWVLLTFVSNSPGK